MNSFHRKKNSLPILNGIMHRHRESFTKEQFDRRMEYGQEVLSNYYDKYIHQL